MVPVLLIYFQYKGDAEVLQKPGAMDKSQRGYLFGLYELLWENQGRTLYSFSFEGGLMSNL